MVADGFVGSDAQWSNMTALEADDMEEDEGELSDWSDGEDEADDEGDEADTDGDHESRQHTPQDNTTGITSSFHT